MQDAARASFPSAFALSEATRSFGVIEANESAVRTYSRSMPRVFSRAAGAEVFDESGCRYIDFLSAAGSLNYGHNDPPIIRAITEYIGKGGILQTLDFATEAKIGFLSALRDIILEPRNLDYRIQFTGPTGTNAVEAAIKLARKVTGRTAIAAFTNAYHGLSLGALALTGNSSKRSASGVPLGNAYHLPYDGYFGETVDTSEYARKLLEDPSSGYERPAAFIVETVQGEGGLGAASAGWLRAIAQLAKDLGALLIIDDIQAGCGRTGQFFSFEQAGIVPDLVCLSKSISGSGLPMAIVLIKPTLDAWAPGEHNGTFRGNNLAFIGAVAALRYWSDSTFAQGIALRSDMIHQRLTQLCDGVGHGDVSLVGRGLFMGLRFRNPVVAETCKGLATDLNLIVETSGPHDEVLKIMPPLNIDVDVLDEGLAIIEGVAAKALRHK